jgi:hypothetical protein
MGVTNLLGTEDKKVFSMKSDEENEFQKELDTIWKQNVEKANEQKKLKKEQDDFHRWFCGDLY